MDYKNHMVSTQSLQSEETGGEADQRLNEMAQLVKIFLRERSWMLALLGHIRNVFSNKTHSRRLSTGLRLTSRKILGVASLWLRNCPEPPSGGMTIL